MQLARGLSTINTKKRKQKKLTQKDIERLTTEWRQYNKRMRQTHCHDMQFDTLEDYISYKQGNYKPKRTKEKEFKEYAPTKPYVRDTAHYPSLQTSDKIPTGSTEKREPQRYTGERRLLGIATMHKSNMVPIFEDNKEQAKEIAQMRRN